MPDARWIVARLSELIVERIRRFQDVGVEHFVFDLRTRFAEFEECVELLGAEVLPVLHRGDGPRRVGD